MSSDTTAPAPSGDRSIIPFSKIWPVGAGALTGVVLRLMFFAKAGDPWSAMSGSFIYLAPFAVSAVTIYFAERKERRTWGYYLAAGTIANFLFVAGTLLILIEGWICAIVILPVFGAIGAIGGLLMGIVCRVTRWPTQTTLCVAVLPLIVGGIEPVEVPQRVQTIERSLLLAAPREIVWRHLMDVRDIRREEFADSIAYRIGVPAPVSALSMSDNGHGRRVTMGKRVYFDQIELERRSGELIRWRQQFYPDSFPPGAFDEHVVMGGHYFDVQEISYGLAPAGDDTRLTLTMTYRVSTRFNWYAEPVARWILGDLESTLLRIYAARAENDRSD